MMDLSRKTEKMACGFTVFSHKNIILNTIRDYIKTNRNSRKEQRILIEVKNLVKKYGSHTAVDGLTFTVEKGQIYGFLGPNGTGKSTTMNILTGYLAATDGSVTIDGHDILKEPEKAKKQIGYLPELPPLYMDMTVGEYLKFAAELKKIKKAAKKYGITLTEETRDYCKPSSYKKRPFHILEEVLHENFPDVITAPFLLTAGTDARRLKDVADSILRFAPIDLTPEQFASVHGEDERISIRNIGECVCFYKDFIQRI